MPEPAARRPGTASTRPRPSAGGSVPRLASQPAPAAPSRQPRACPERLGSHRADCRRGKSPDLAAAPDRAPGPPAPLAPAAARHAPPPEPRRGPHHGPARAPASLVSGRRGGGRMAAHDSAGPHASLVPPLPVFPLRCPPGPPWPRLGAGPGLGRRGAADAGGWRPCPRSAHGDGEPLQARPAEAGRSPAQRSGTAARAAGQDRRPGTSYPPRPARPASRAPGR
jgi:hypothetical protein